VSDRPDPDPRLSARVRRGAGAALILVLGALGIAVLVTALGPHGGTTVLAPGAPTGAATDPAVSAASGPTIYVHVLGQVRRPGLYLLRDGDRAVDAIAAAGGLTDDADPAGVNLARFLSDGEQILVPRVGEAPPGGATDASGRVNLNTADAAALESLPRIGPAIAERIIAWREQNGRFTTVDDLLEVSGIGQKMLEALRDLVTT
jgi:competence protein ComEA